jgi:predicted Zn-dependent protease
MAANERIQQIKTFLNDNPNDPFLYYALATEYAALAEDSLALELFIDLTKDYPDYYATYYHLGKLYEKIGEELKAEEAYKTGMEVTKRLHQKHAYGELLGAFEELTF